MENKPLSKIRVLDLTQNICGPLCTQYLYDLGAEVIKIESPEGDESRRRGTTYGDTSIAYMYVNRGKKSVTLDITKSEQKEILLRLAEKSDIVVEDLGAGKADELGVGYEAVKNVKDDIVYLSITDFGHKGPFKNYKGNDAILQAISGYMSLTSMTYQGKFTKLTTPMSDLMGGMYAVIGAIAGLIHRKKTGESIYVDVSKLSCMLMCMPDSYAKYMTYGEKAFPTGNAHRMSAVFYPMPTKDGAIICNPDNRNPSETKWQNFCREIGIPEEWYEDDKFNSLKSRLEHRSEVEEMVNAHTVNFTVAEIEEICRKYKIAAGVMNDMKQLVEHPQTIHDKLIISVHDTKEGDFRVMGCPLKFSEFDTLGDSFVDQLGEHTAEVLESLLGIKAE